MKKILLALIGMGIVLIIGSQIWINLYPVEPLPNYVEKSTVDEVATVPVEVKPTPKKVTKPVKINPKPKELFKCDGRKYCSQMKSYEEAKYFNDFCPNTKMDGDYDGIPCERQFGR